MQLQRHGWESGARSGGETLTFVPAEAKLRPLRDQLIIEPLDVVHSRHILIADRSKPLRGRVLAAGPGKYAVRYDHPEKHKRTKVMQTQRFVPTEVKVGDLVELGGAEIGGYAFEGFYWGDKYAICCTERDVCGIVTEAA